MTNVQISVGNPVLGDGAVAAVKKWKFTPFTENGAPAKASTTLSLWLNPAAFSIPAVHTFGSLGRNALRGPRFEF